ncbi:MAG: hypothetical protein HOO06_15525 [Bdellovibrionaceae bacterium]|nr:hypothetical protein [Pseudobdellovibrionaceae bacterium]
MKLLFSGLFLFYSFSQALAKEDKVAISLSSLYTTYNDITISNAATSTSGTDAIVLEPTVDVEVGLRMFGPYNFILGVGQSIDQLRSSFGAGIRVDLPGFFFFGSQASDLGKHKRKYPVNTSGFFISSLTTIKAASTATTSTAAVSNRWGISMEIFLFNRLTYLITQISFYSVQGNSYTSPIVGLGVNF